MFRAIRQDTVHIVNDPSGLCGHDMIPLHRQISMTAKKALVAFCTLSSIHEVSFPDLKKWCARIMKSSMKGNVQDRASSFTTRTTSAELRSDDVNP